MQNNDGILDNAISSHSTGSSSLTRRGFQKAALGGLVLICRQARAADFTIKQYHNQPVEAPLHKRLTQMWAAVEKETRGRVTAVITPLNNNMKDGDPDPLPMMLRGEIDFFTVAGNNLAGQVPAYEAQATPYVFRDSAHALRVCDGELGDYLREELKAKGLYALPKACFDNGIHQITTTNKPVRTAADLQGMKMRVPGSQLYHDFFRAYGVTTMTTNINMLYDALKSGKAEAQDDPYDVAELFKLYEVQKYMNVTEHSWSGFNLLANLKRWQSMPADVQTIIERNAAKYVRLQRADAARSQRRLRKELVKKGMVFVESDIASFRANLSPYYARWKSAIGSKATAIIEAQAGKMA
ncbi:MAG: TRAP transporter substrate-binding protein [Bryobacteraceae bacterium]